MSVVEWVEGGFSDSPDLELLPIVSKISSVFKKSPSCLILRDLPNPLFRSSDPGWGSKTKSSKLHSELLHGKIVQGSTPVTTTGTLV